MKILHLDSSILDDASVSRQLSSEIVSKLRQQHPDAQVTSRDLVADPIPYLTGSIAAGFRAPAGTPVTDPHTLAEHTRSTQLADEFLASDVIVIGAPMYNFSVASQLKSWLDRIAQVGRTFRYTVNGPIGLSGGRCVIIASTRGGMYSEGTAAGMDFQESYLKAFFGFLGITDVHFVRAERLTKGGEVRDHAISSAIVTASEAVSHALNV